MGTPRIDLYLFDLHFLLWEWNSVPLFLPILECSVLLLLKQRLGERQ